MFKERLKLLRKNKGLTQKELADILHVSQQTVGSWEVGRAFPDESTVNKLSTFFNVSIDYLYGKDVPGWASSEDVVELEKVLEDNVNMSYGGENLTEEEKQRVKDIITGLFWEKAQKRKEGGVNDRTN
ncbi:helix-turn-helix transcriptional regulator [Marinilactibacillus psychrotolerans]|uniref:Helix-turn-helix transcriptional regulator n=1 Tax=Marinilactibacillus psychrotolerans TaxID=191770 RepID=A0A5R9C707_9LACT|nr:helix-turn-helix transcriptional regulator [Marinilactibacillus psychrotolerans]TLQ08805.1 helix-turn-helix transcriptional regulator [Marinilactibacillus psychrotolerans]